MPRICEVCDDIVSKRNVNGYVIYKCFNCNRDGCLDCVEECYICKRYVCGECSMDICPCSK